MNGGALINGCRRSLLSPCFKFISSTSLCATHHKTSNACAPQTTSSSYSPFESKIRRILSSEIQYQCDYAPPHQPLAEYGRFMVEDRPGEQWVTLRGKPDEEENIKIEATMFDGFIVDQKACDRSTQENVQLFHISMLVDIWRKGEGSSAMKFVCSAWPNSLEIHKVFIFTHDESPAQLYTGPHFNGGCHEEIRRVCFTEKSHDHVVLRVRLKRNLNTKLQAGFYQLLKTRGLDDGLSMFLHKYMMNKDRIELIQWLGKVNCFLKM